MKPVQIKGVVRTSLDEEANPPKNCQEDKW
jgi:hypothetical protein